MIITKKKKKKATKSNKLRVIITSQMCPITQ